MNKRMRAQVKIPILFRVELISWLIVPKYKFIFWCNGALVLA